MSRHILDTLCASNRQHDSEGIYSVCSAHPLVLEAAFLRALEDDSPLLVEATCNQVNQDGGYTGKTPQDFRDDVIAIARRLGFPEQRLILGGDHLGPSPWQQLPAEEAMAKAEAMVAAYAAAGFEKLHLDASMACADDPRELDDCVVAERAARLCRAAETAAEHQGGASALRYVIGTEVPTPGGANEHIDSLEVTATEDLKRTLETHVECFEVSGLGAAWHRVVAVVVQPGVEFGHTEVIDFEPEKARDLSRVILEYPNIVFEAHSTDYQTSAAYAQLVTGHFAILKVGPALTFAMREALFALEQVAREAPSIADVPLRETLEKIMLEQPKYWQAYYEGDEDQQRFARRYSLSDRIRYYWSVPEVASQVEALFDGLSKTPPPLTLLSQYLPVQYAAIREGDLNLEPRAIVHHYIGETLKSYSRACLPVVD